jgi:hypothetical protein
MPFQQQLALNGKPAESKKRQQCRLTHPNVCLQHAESPHCTAGGATCAPSCPQCKPLNHPVPTFQSSLASIPTVNVGVVPPKLAASKITCNPEGQTQRVMAACVTKHRKMTNCLLAERTIYHRK